MKPVEGPSIRATTIPTVRAVLLILLFLSGFPLSICADSSTCDLRQIDRDLATLKGVLEDWPATVTGKELAETKELFLATIAALTECVEAHPNDRDIAWRVGECYRLGNNLEAQTQYGNDSKKYLDRALELDENYVPAYLSLGKLFIQTYRKMTFERPGFNAWEWIHIADDYFMEALDRSGNPVDPDIYKGLSFTPHYSNPWHSLKFEGKAVALAKRYLDSRPDDESFERIFQTYQIKQRILAELSRAGEETLVFLPPDYEDGVRYPVVIFLPCTGGTALGEFMKYLEVMELFSFIAVLPRGSGSTADHDWEGFTACIERFEAVIEEALASVRSKHGVDEDRIILAGWSLGGDLSWALSMRHPRLYRGAIMAGTRCAYPASQETLETLRRRDYRACFVTGEDELPARLEGIRAANELLESHGMRTLYVETSGGHVSATVQEFKHGLDLVLQ